MFFVAERSPRSSLFVWVFSDASRPWLPWALSFDTRPQSQRTCMRILDTSVFAFARLFRSDTLRANSPAFVRMHIRAYMRVHPVRVYLLAHARTHAHVLHASRCCRSRTGSLDARASITRGHRICFAVFAFSAFSLYTFYGGP